MSAVSVGGTTLISSGAFSRTESQRGLTVQIAEDDRAYLGLVPLDTPNSNEYVEKDDHGHLEIIIGENSNGGHGVNSNSNTRFEGLFDVCNQGTAEATIEFLLDEAARRLGANVLFEDEDGKPVTNGTGEVILAPGECETISLDIGSHDVDATEDTPIYGGTVTVKAVSVTGGDGS